MTPEEIEYANKQADYMRDLMKSCSSKDDAIRAGYDDRYELQKKFEAAEARATQAEQERDELRAAFLGQLKTIEELRQQLELSKGELGVLRQFGQADICKSCGKFYAYGFVCHCGRDNSYSNEE